MEIKAKEGNWVTLYKVSDDVFGGNHPNGIYANYVQRGTLVKDVTIGERCNVVGKHYNDYLSTSKVTEIIDEITFKTENSTYTIEKNEDL